MPRKKAVRKTTTRSKKATIQKEKIQFFEKVVKGAKKIFSPKY